MMSAARWQDDGWFEDGFVRIEMAAALHDMWRENHDEKQRDSALVEINSEVEY